MTEEKLFVMLKKLNELEKQKEELRHENGPYYRQHGKFYPEYSEILDKIASIKENFEKRSRYFEIYYDDEYVYTYMLLPKSEKRSDI